MNYSDISNDIYYNDDFSYLENIDSNDKDKSNLDIQILCDVDNLYNKAMEIDSNNYNKSYNENNRKIEEDINKMFLYNKNYYNQLMEQYKRDISISLPKHNIDILNSIYRTEYDIGILNNVKFGENVDCNEEQLKTIRNCSSACSRNECNYENLNVILGGCRINDIPQSYGETFCVDEQDNCLSIQRQYIENCSKDCYSCDAETSDITLDGCLINNISQIYGDTFCSDNNINVCSKIQKEYYERCKKNCNSCNRIAADTFMNNCTIDGKRPIHSQNYCINCNLYNSGDPTSCVSIKSLDNNMICDYTPRGRDEIPASCKYLNNPNSSNYSGFDGTKESCPEDRNFYFIPSTPESNTERTESCSQIINCNIDDDDDIFSCVSIESDTQRCIYNTNESKCINSENENYQCTDTTDCYHVCSNIPDGDDIETYRKDGIIHIVDTNNELEGETIPSNVIIVQVNQDTSGSASTRSCSELYDYTQGYCDPRCNYDPNKCPENEGYKYIFNTGNSDKQCILKPKYN